MSDDLKMAHLLCTRLCHDLAGPVGAISAGVELMGSDPSLIDAETMSLLSGSADAAGRKLKFLRIAFGWSGTGAQPVDALEGIFGEYMAATTGPSGMPKITWPLADSLGLVSAKLGEPSSQVLANILLLAVESRPACRSLIVDIKTVGTGIEVAALNRSAEGRSMSLKEESVAAALGEPGAVLTPHTVQAHLARRLITGLGGDLSIDGDEAGATTTARWS